MKVFNNGECTMDNKDFMSDKELQEALGISRATMFNLIRRPAGLKIKNIRIGIKRYWLRASVQKYLNTGGDNGI